MNNGFLITSLLAATMSLSGCASVTRGMSENVKIYASPDDAKITTDIEMVCESSPCELKVPRKSEFTVTVSKPGYKTQVVDVKTIISENAIATMAGNAIMPGGTIGAGIDVYTGATLNHIPNPVLVELQPTNPSSPHTPPGDLSKIRKEVAEKKKAYQERVMRQGGGV